MTARIGLLTTVLVTAVLLTTVVAPALAIGAVRPDVVLLTVVAFALADGPATGARYGFAAGLTSDLVSGGGALVGASAFALLAVGYLVGAVRPYLAGSDRVAQIVSTVGATVVSTGAQALLAVLLGTSTVSAFSVLATAVGLSLYHVVLIPVVVRPVTALSRRFGGPVTA